MLRHSIKNLDFCVTATLGQTLVDERVNKTSLYFGAYR